MLLSIAHYPYLVANFFRTKDVDIMKIFKVLLMSLFFLMASNAVAKKKPIIFASNYPLAYFAKRMCHTSVDFPKTKIDPSRWEPSASEVKKIQRADLILINGAGYEKWLPKVSNTKATVVDCSKAFRDQYIVRENSNSQENPDYYRTTWIDFTQAVRMLDAVKVALEKSDRWNKKEIEKNYRELKNELLTFDEQIKNIVSKNKALPLLVSDSNYDYFARRYGVNLKTLHWQHDHLPSEKQWRLLKHIVIDHPAKWMVWEIAPDPNIASGLKTCGVRSIVFNPCATKPQSGDFMTVMKQNVTNLRIVYFANDLDVS